LRGRIDIPPKRLIVCFFWDNNETNSNGLRKEFSATLRIA